MNKRAFFLLLVLWLAFHAAASAYYDPTTKTFLSRDPIREAGGINLYAYCNNDPIGNFDPIGLSAYTDSMDDAADDLANGHWWRGEAKAAGVSLWEAFSFGSASGVGNVADRYDAGELSLGQATGAGGLVVAHSALDATLTFLPAARLGKLARSGGIVIDRSIPLGRAMLKSAAAGTLFGGTWRTSDVLFDRSISAVEGRGYDGSLFGDVQSIGTSSAFGGLGGLLLGPAFGRLRTSAPTSFWSKAEFNGTRIYQRNDLIDPALIDVRGRTNLQRMLAGLAPIGPDGKPINLHHTIQMADGPLAEMTTTFHQQNSRIIHINPNTTPSWRQNPGAEAAFEAFRRAYWMNRANDFSE